MAVSGRGGGRWRGGVGGAAAEGRRRASPTRQTGPPAGLKTRTAGLRARGSRPGSAGPPGIGGASGLDPGAQRPGIPTSCSVSGRGSPRRQQRGMGQRRLERCCVSGGKESYSSLKGSTEEGAQGPQAAWGPRRTGWGRVTVNRGQ
ncbi:hypothetical protein NDU88_003612 [Pleurodeles waltl]|uniref:Uncharacterized protein n=1 Tax=Pleurodeles waltl TaxID=8319 RepID=A0AAV7QC75_PLEWA|nr:hypothetical protein NDU88_003612 [Pleurodeles waltl]